MRVLRSIPSVTRWTMLEMRVTMRTWTSRCVIVICIQQYSHSYQHHTYSTFNARLQSLVLFLKRKYLYPVDSLCYWGSSCPIIWLITVHWLWRYVYVQHSWNYYWWPFNMHGHHTTVHTYIRTLHILKLPFPRSLLYAFFYWTRLSAPGYWFVHCLLQEGVNSNSCLYLYSGCVLIICQDQA